MSTQGTQIMSKVVVGSIPDKISYVYGNAKECPVGSYWEIEWDPKVGYLSKSEKLNHTVICDSADDRQLTKAKAEVFRYNAKQNAPLIKEVDNKPISGVKILSVSSYAVRVYYEKHVFEIGHEILMDALMHSGASVGAELNGDFIWVKMHGKMKLIKANSKMHKEITDYNNRSKLKVISKRMLKPGTIYQDKRKNQSLFVGYVDTTQYISTYQSLNYDQRNKQTITFDYINDKKSKHMLFLDISKYDRIVGLMDKINNFDVNYFSIKKTHNFIEEVNSVNLPDNYIDAVRKNYIKVMRECLVNYSNNNYEKPLYHWDNRSNKLDREMMKYSVFVNMYHYKGKPAELFEIKKLLAFA
jgi:hypothetical protein